MSDLAPFVAAALRDKTVMELMEENQKLAKQHRQARAVEITGYGGDPVYARALLDEDGDYDKDHVDLWNVTFSNGPLLTCSLSELMDVHIHLGGVCFAQFGSGSCSGVIDCNKEEGKTLSFSFTRTTSLDVFIHGGLKNFWKIAFEELESSDVFDFVLDTLPPETKVTFRMVTFTANTIQGAMDNFIPKHMEMKRGHDVP